MESALQPESGENPAKITCGGICRKLNALRAAITVEPVLFCYSLPANMLFTATQNFNLEKACSVNLNYSATVCHSLAARNKSGYNITEEQSVQALVASVNGYSSFLQGFLICITLLIVGSWSDKNHKRKPLLMIPLMGDITSALLLLVSLGFYEQLPVEFNAFAEAVPLGLAGGWFCMNAASMAYVGEDSSAEKRITRFGATSVTFLFATYTGLALGGLLFNKIQLYQIYIIIIAIHFVGMAYTYFRIEEIATKEVNSKAKSGVFLDVLNLGHIKKTFRFLFVEGSKQKRRKLWLRLIAMWTSFGPWYGERVVIYLYVRYRFGWNEIDHSMLMMFMFIATIFGIPFWLTIFTKLLKVDHCIIGIFAGSAKITACFIYMFAPYSTIFYLGMYYNNSFGLSWEWNPDPAGTETFF